MGKRIYQRHELKSEQREVWRRQGERVALLHTLEGQENVVVGRFHLPFDRRSA